MTWSSRAFLLRVSVISAAACPSSAEQPHIADIGAEHDVEGVARERHQADHAVQRDIGQHPRRDVPGRAKRAGLAHQPQRDRRRDDVADHRDQADQAVDAVADIGARQDEGDVEQFRQRLEPRQPLLAGEIAERVGAGSSEVELKAARMADAAPRRGFRAPPGRSQAHGPSRRLGAGTFGAGAVRRKDVVVWHGHQMVTQKACASCVTLLAVLV